MTESELIAIIPARGGSTRLTNKNLFEIKGKPLISYTIESALKWGKFDKIYINSEDPDILACAKKYRVKTYTRPEHLSTDKSKVLDVVKEQITMLSIPEQTVLSLLLPTCPLRTEKDLEAAFQLFCDHKESNGVVSVTKYEKSPAQALILDGKGCLIPNDPENYTSRSQDHGAAYRYNTAIIFKTARAIMASNDIVGIGCVPYIMSFENSIDIDYAYHVKLVEAILSESGR